METCQYCGRPLGNPDTAKRYWEVCDGELEFAPDPYAADIYNDDTPVWMCYGARLDSADDI